MIFTLLKAVNTDQQNSDYIECKTYSSCVFKHVHCIYKLGIIASTKKHANASEY